MRLLAPTLAILLLASPAAASQVGHDAVTEVVDAAVAAENGSIAYVEAKDELYSIAADEQVLPACRTYADTALVAFLLIDAKTLYPRAQSLDALFAVTMQRLATVANDCLLAV